MRGNERAANDAPEMMMSTVPICRPWLMSLSLPRLEAGNTWMSYLPLLRFLISSAAHTDHLWYGSDVSYTCAHLSACACAIAGPATASESAANRVFSAMRLIIGVSFGGR